MEKSTEFIEPAFEETFFKYHGLQKSTSILQNEDVHSLAIRFQFS